MDMTKLTKEQRERKKRARIEQRGGDDGYQWCLIVDDKVRYSGMQRGEADWRRKRFINDGSI